MNVPIVAVCAALAAAGILLMAGAPGPAEVRVDPGPAPGTDADPAPGPAGHEVVVDGLDTPWSIGWLPDGTILYTERGGTLSSWDGAKRELLSLDVAGGEGGLLGLEIDPGFAENGNIYLYHTYDASIASTMNRVDRFVLEDGAVSHEATLIDGIPGSFIHDGGRIRFGPDGMLYIATGDAANPALSQDPGSLAGKILRIDRDGGIPADNPFPGSPVYSLGHRNPQGMDWDGAGRMLITEHGPSGLGSGYDEINAVIPGGNYGWPRGVGDSHEGWIAPVYHTGTDTWAPSGSEFYTGGAVPGWDGRYLVAGLRGQSLYVMDVGDGGPSFERWYEGEFGRLRDVATGPDGRVYLLTSNGEDDAIIAIPGAQGHP
ncbi:MAG: PQQ-dependent sugar dehydrogenase [Nitrosopumilus sp.]|nr:PQQ-dependent sugar dehydrogenase [Nitrosopumilus sp.]MDA7943921.1 PQQ-dependent sugar dehydrogenase [Nitrosopumilus sp.]MDA7959955.1 PQQ-dependent sugar dehydrogenase [Nitrosopumilus sp.]MDA7998944.1 PQQ-dependent sugar dehydrogenase [Nitrosopumilus sp.]